MFRWFKLNQENTSKLFSTKISVCLWWNRNSMEYKSDIVFTLAFSVLLNLSAKNTKINTEQNRFCLKSVNSKEPNVPDIKLPKRKQILINGEHFWNFCFYSTLDCYKLWVEISGILIKGGYGLGWGSHQLPERPDGDSITNSNINVSFVSHWESAQNKETATPFFYSIDSFSAFWGHKSLRQSLFASRRG